MQPSIASHSGRYYVDCHEKQASQRARNEEDQKRLWEISEKMVEGKVKQKEEEEEKEEKREESK